MHIKLYMDKVPRDSPSYPASHVLQSDTDTQSQQHRHVATQPSTQMHAQPHSHADAHWDTASLTQDHHPQPICGVQPQAHRH